MANDNIQVEVLDSSSEFRPGRKGGSVNWMQLLFGRADVGVRPWCVFCPFEVLMGISAIIAVRDCRWWHWRCFVCALSQHAVFRKAYGACSSAP